MNLGTENAKTGEWNDQIDDSITSWSDTGHRINHNFFQELFAGVLLTIGFNGLVLSVLFHPIDGP